MRLAPGVLLGVLFACSRPSPLVVDRVQVDRFVGGEVAAMSGTQLGEALAVALGEAKFLVVEGGRAAPRGVVPWRLELAAGLSEPDLEQQSSVLEVVLEFSHAGDRDGFEVRGHQQVRAPASNDAVGLQGALRQALGGALRRAALEAAAVITLDAAPSPELVQRLGASEPEVHSAAVRLLARRRDEAALAPLLARLTGDDVDAFREVIGLLVELGSPRAVNPLIELAQRRGPLFEREVLFAVAAIGGSDAEAYLDLVATGHEDPVLRESAETALAELRARQARTHGDATK